KDGEGRPVSQVAISASQLFVFDPNNPDNTAYPFAVSGGKVVIPKAMIYDAVIETLTAQRVVADEVKAGVSITSPVIRSAVIQNGNFQVDSQGNLNIGGLFSVTSQGQLTIRYSNQNVGLVIRNDKIEVYDQNGRLAVRIGRLR
ncbi:DUF1983 domain-containing protein, partial [Escherichia coli]|nr:DUF1983 domain-containing protein [Escherichia coli]